MSGHAPAHGFRWRRVGGCTEGGCRDVSSPAIATMTTQRKVPSLSARMIPRNSFRFGRSLSRAFEQEDPVYSRLLHNQHYQSETSRLSPCLSQQQEHEAQPTGQPKFVMHGSKDQAPVGEVGAVEGVVGVVGVGRKRDGDFNWTRCVKNIL